MIEGAGKFYPQSTGHFHAFKLPICFTLNPRIAHTDTFINLQDLNPLFCDPFVLKGLKPRVTLEAVVKEAGYEFGCDSDQILRKGLKKNVARDVAIYLARELTGESNVALGTLFGRISEAGITVCCNYIAKHLTHNRRLKGRVNRIAKQIINN